MRARQTYKVNRSTRPNQPLLNGLPDIGDTATTQNTR